MRIRPFIEEDSSAVVELWNTEATKYDYQPFTELSFREAFIEHRYYDADCMWVGCIGDDIVSFAAGCSGDDLPLGHIAGYITTVIIANKVAEAKHSDALLECLEERFIALGKKQSEVLFFNPVKLKWNIPSNPNHEHNNAPGISKDQPLYGALLTRGYLDRATQCGMYLPLSDFTIPENIIEKEKNIMGLEYQITIFNPSVHTGLQSLLSVLQNTQWEKDVTYYMKRNVPIVVAVQGTACVGFAGPIIRQDNGRAFFSGIGVHPEHEGYGLGSVLFFRMVDAFKRANCDYITLFTGRENPAIRIYQKAGFTVEKEFSILRKELEHE
ncbi:GNAT family N-acetyltransferase [Paenibacillus endoradicis]|uniref:GNAT family N-acetyltransferase n=1 Tax=Paenibacillus endoradicis TaxID=2972487 RepID=UPI00215903CC|nr:GNAT family N-acetyltransferase [Paenibacillus endoradicis]MCR8657216.1 GNAT family N-acetyltransferase [Paenibacillus endoradicis]